MHARLTHRVPFVSVALLLAAGAQSSALQSASTTNKRKPLTPHHRASWSKAALSPLVAAALTLRRSRSETGLLENGKQKRR